MVSASKSAATGDKKKSKKSSRPSSKDKDHKTKDKDKDRKSSSKRQREKTPPAPPPEPAASTPTPPPPVSVVHDPDAIQLFRRYDRNRSGVLTRLDFLQLLRDYADPTSGWGTSLSRPPLSLTDTSGIPLGYQRADRNSEFEAGQLFERYDRDHTGALSLDTFHAFFADFKPQLRAFVEEGNYRALARPPPVAVAPVPLHPVQEEEPVPQVRDAVTGGDTPLPSPKVIRAPSQYEKQADLGSLLRVKDQMIYQLLQERSAMRKERAAVETSLRKLSEVSTREMKKWARLTDDMQTEIEQLRSQLRLQAQQRHAMTTR
ncbi:hypothetical protein PF005_g7213 [Phytophthora fragariae]|uniref:EF-hand domain-containing protein n=1 Tax=Phytophthora fragariae TaxID=53985 RepID=A0A6A3UDB7_9STRA|nr:hypothetical protein PF003_g12255 [Phytophthora fragariae]KAE8942822.1 hypothetical protein PF009_g7437 [Phytophthora fragariae]KAE9122841.1 hypothetical protein PF007_g7280 [Phytophthora fragariae]KAE9124420.1 hypothetical protein PF010_g6014 [Phytophthora fragariae]KAE9148391.1 hypothetical protein PF006_g7009 [Phytophthora fragariae]